MPTQFTLCGQWLWRPGENVLGEAPENQGYQSGAEGAAAEGQHGGAEDGGEDSEDQSGDGDGDAGLDGSSGAARAREEIEHSQGQCRAGQLRTECDERQTDLLRKQ